MSAVGMYENITLYEICICVKIAVRMCTENAVSLDISYLVSLPLSSELDDKVASMLILRGP